MFGSWVRSSELSTQKTSDSILLPIRLKERRGGVLAGSNWEKKVKISGGVRVVQIEREEGRGWRWIERTEKTTNRVREGENHMYSFMGWGKEMREGENTENGENKTGWWDRTEEIKGKKIIKKWLFN